MKLLAAVGGFVFGLVFGAPFFGALLMGVAAWAIVHYVQKGNAEAAAPPAAGVAATPAATARMQKPATDIDDFSSLRTYVEKLTLRVHALERQVASLKGEPAASRVADEPAPQAPILEAPPVRVPMRQEAQPVQAARPEEPRRADQPRPPQQPSVEGTPRLREPIAVSKAAKDPRVEESLSALEESPAGPAEPSLLSRLLAGNIVAKVGAIVLFFGVGFLLKFAYDRGMMPPELRLAGVALAAAVVFVLGWKFKESRRLYGLILQGVASGLLYLDVFFALKTYGFIGPALGFSLFALLGVVTTMLAVRQDAKPLALLGLTGAFIAPMLAATGSGNYVFLFSYYLLLNLFILAVSWFKAWRVLNLTGWFFTFAVAALWGSRSYRPEMFWTIEPFLLAFFAIYLVIPILFATRQPPLLKGLVDGTLVFGTPAAVAVMQSRLVWDMPYGLAWSAAIGAALYTVLSLMVLRHQNMRLLSHTYIALAVGLATLAIFFAFGAYTTFALWSIEGAALLWVGLRQKNPLARAFALFVQAAGAGYFFLDYGRYSRFNPFFNDAILGCAIIVLASLVSASLLRRYRNQIEEGERNLTGFILAWAAIWWSLGGADVIHHGIEPLFKPAAVIMLFSATTIAAELTGARISWGGLRALSGVQPLALYFAAALQLTDGSHPLADLGWIAWPLGMGSLFWILHRQRRDAFDAAFDVRYLAAWLILGVIATWEAAWHLYYKNYMTCLAIALVGYIAAGLRYRLREHGTQRAQMSTLPLLWAMFFWFAAGLGWIHERFPAEFEVRAALLFVAGSALVFEVAYSALEWLAMRWAARLPWLAMPAALAFEFGLGSLSHPFSGWLGLVWPIAWLLAIYGLRREEADDERVATGLRHAIALFVPILLATWELAWWLVEWMAGQQWRLAGLACPSIGAVLIVLACRDVGRWPLREHWPLYRDALLTPLIALLVLWTLVANIRAPGDLRPLGLYLPLLNPLDLTIGAAAVAVAGWGRCLESGQARATLWKGLAVLGFVWGNAIALRSVHYWADVPYRFDALASSVLVQATLSILWTSAALTLMVFARRRMQRQLWIVGAALLAVVVGKLFLVDLSNTGTVARIVSFLGVGVLLLIIGYLAPVPPGAKEAEGPG